jgi:hypothetical protein
LNFSYTYIGAYICLTTVPFTVNGLLTVLTKISNILRKIFQNRKEGVGVVVVVEECYFFEGER